MIESTLGSGLIKVNSINSVMEGAERREEAEPQRATGTQRTVQDACVTDGTKFFDFVTEVNCKQKSGVCN